MVVLDTLKDDLAGPVGRLVKRAIEGDKRAFKALYERIAGKMYSLCLRYTGIENDAKEAFQDGVSRLYASLPGYKGAGSFESWARKIFVLSCIDCVKKKEMISYPVPHFTGSPALYTTIIKSDDTIEPAILHSMIQQLPASYRLIANICLVEEYEPGEAWAILGVPEATGKHVLSQVTMLLSGKILLMQNGMARLY
jgi:RNA polymerase sigma factor (sigma-70 family)